MCDKPVDACPFVFDSVPGLHKTQEKCDKVVRTSYAKILPRCI